MSAHGIAGAILAGGRSTRFSGGRKHEARFAGAPLIDHVIARAAPQVKRLGISVASEGCAIRDNMEMISDIVPDCGPLGGVHAGLVWAATLAPPADWLATFACDTPIFPEDVVSRLHVAARKAGAPGAVASSGGEIQPTFGVWRVALASLAQSRLATGDFSLRSFVKASGAIVVEFAVEPGNSFRNVNTLEDLRSLE